MRRAEEFLTAVRYSQSLHRGLVSPPPTLELYRAYLARTRRQSHEGYFIILTDGQLAGVVNINEIVRGYFQSGYLGFYAFMPHAGHGHMFSGLRLVISQAFRSSGLHRLEANIQPGNARSISLVKRIGFRHEGRSPRYLKIGGRWRDHERWAITVEDWRRTV